MPQTHRPFAAALWMIASILGFTMVAVAGRALHPFLDTYEVMLWRSVVGIVTVTGVATALGRLTEVSADRLLVHALRNAIHFAGQNLWLVALSLIPVAQLFALEFSYPIMVALAAPFLLGERLTRIRAISALIGFGGILTVARPFGAEGLSPGLLAALAAAMCFAGSALMTRWMTRSMTITCILFWLVMFQALYGLIGAGADGRIALPPPAALPWVVAIGLGGLGGHLGLTKALSLAPAAVVTPIDFLRLPLIALVGMQLYDEQPDIWVLVGGAITFGANWLNIWSEKRNTSALQAQMQQP